MSNKLLTGLLICTFLFQCSSDKQATDDQKNWCYGQYTKFVNSFELLDTVDSTISVFVPKDSVESKSFISVFTTNYQSAIDIYNNEYDKNLFEEPEYIDLTTEILNSYEKKLRSGHAASAAVAAIDIRRKALLNEFEGSLEFCKILYDVSI